MKSINCHKCNMQFAVSNAFYATALQMKEDLTFYCPAGHPQVFVSGESQETKLRRERDRLKQNTAMLEDSLRHANADRDAARRSASAYKGTATRMKNRAKAGVCPCCNRTFLNLARHMKSQHTDDELNNVVELGQSA